MPRIPDTIRTARKVEEATERLAQARAARDVAIVNAAKAGRSAIDIAAEVGLTRQGVYNVLWTYGTHGRVNAG